MSDKLSLKNYSALIASEMQTLVREAAEPIEAGKSVKAQINAAHQNLGRPSFWRVREAWYGDAGDWKGAVVEEFRDRFKALNDIRERRARAEAAQLAALHRQTAEALRAIDQDFHRDTIDALERAANGAGLGNSPMAQADR